MISNQSSCLLSTLVSLIQQMFSLSCKTLVIDVQKSRYTFIICMKKTYYFRYLISAISNFNKFLWIQMRRCQNINFCQDAVKIYKHINFNYCGNVNFKYLSIVIKGFKYCNMQSVSLHAKKFLTLSRLFVAIDMFNR